MNLRLWITGGGLLLSTLTMAETLTNLECRANTGPQRRSLPADGKITITDYGYRDWPASLVEFTVPAGRLKPGPVCLTDASGTNIPAQVDGDILAFVAALTKGTTVKFSIGDGAPAAGTLKITASQQTLEIANEFFAMRFPPLGKQEFPVAQEAAKVSGPVTAWQPTGGQWFGGSRFVTKRNIVSLECKFLRNGPAVVEYEARYRFAPAGEYVFRARICPGIDHADFAEEYDFNEITAGQDFVIMELQKGFSPATIGRSYGELESVIKREPLTAVIDAALKAKAPVGASVGGQGATPLPPQPEADLVLVDRIIPIWHLIGSSQIELRGAETSQGSPAMRVTLVPIHPGSWRRAQALTIWQKPEAGLSVALPISTRPATWYSDTTDDLSPFSTHVHDPGLRPSYGRREVALYFGDLADGLESRIGHVGLDRYKDWILDWPETAKAADYPHAYYTKAQVDRLKKVLDQHPDKQELSKLYVFSGRKADADANGKKCLDGINATINGSAKNWVVSNLTIFRQYQWLAGPLAIADDALACPDLDPGIRRDLRRALAVVAYQLSDPDMNPRGAGGHLGNNNMPFTRNAAVPCSAGLLPDHPLYHYWMEQSARMFEDTFGQYFAADGASLEPPMYQLFGPLRFASDAATVIHNTGGPDLSARLVDNGWYLANITMPDPRYDGRRILPGMGNSGNFLDGCYGFLIAAAERLKPELAPHLHTAQKQAWPTEPISTLWGNNISMAFRYLTDVPESKQPLVTTVLPTYGVVFRAHAGTPDETAMLFRIGSAWGHWDPDALNAILYGKGAPLSPGTGYQYYFGEAKKNEAIYHNQVKVGRPDLPEVFGRVDKELRDYGFGANADYAIGSDYYPPEIFADKAGELEWHRHVLFLKSAQPAGANYFVMRDTFLSATPRPNWWTWLNLEGPDRIKVDGQAFKKEDTTLNKTLPVDKLAAKAGQTLEMETDFGASTWFWFDGKRAFRPRITFDCDVKNSARLGMADFMFPKLPVKETKTALEGVGAPGQDWFYVVFPRKSGEPVPQVEKLAEGVLKIVTAESTDYVFVSDTQIEFKRDGVEFTGKAGTVRVFKDHVALCLNAGVGKVGYQGCVLTGPGPFEKTVALSALKAGETKLAGESEKKWQTIDIGEGLTVKGEASFTAKLDGHVIRISAAGRARQIFVTKPQWTNWVRYDLDGVQMMPCWTDYPASGWGSYKNTRLIALTVPAGQHELTVSDYVYPAVWTRPFVPSISGAEIVSGQK